MKRYGWLLGALGLLAAGLLAGCGGSSSPPPSSITLTVKDPAGNFNAAAYQVGSGSWQALSMSGTGTLTGSFNLSGNTKYGVAVRCSNLEVKVIQADASELANPTLECSSTPPSTVPFTVNVSVAAGLLAAGDQVCVNGMSCASAAVSVSLSTNLEPGSNRDILVTLVDSSNSPKVAKVVKNVSVSSGGNTSVTLATADQLAPVSVTPPSPPAGYTPSSGGALYASPNGASGFVFVPPSSYRPVSGFGGSDLYAAFAIATSGGSSVTDARFFNSGAPSLSFPNPWATGGLTFTPSAHPSVAGLNRPESTLRSYQLYFQIPGQIYYTAIVTKGWLGSTTSYAFPDLSAASLLGYTPPTGPNGSFDIRAILSNKPVFVLTSISGFQTGDHYQEAMASISSYTVGSGSINFP
ncbi:hypothetical protein Mesil_3439 (plasmid) [Allomeiothermus silvanus DSM 9946]|uniref:Peptidase S8 and S53 subtilisin kexin sedolisin n=1 Tax=Allomeiothermus silvanus (strain ATCC 700542 / DSM 9946 / NBRC 106475 / NCIMB 13440 / VI-R2) TaxID=526227 RepID=D7BIM4_ALLS1|nr:hypothetical protein [Allomeiothermus silvanus]ADH65030.1 peptidase S8 and S53 subtilisin kexin sedolisin [Allomeiothermus silvanus DSM 9946]ADH65247.1 hypothetical protein Mesil_3439 [Allomeiothermus silvanus DSM 9946]